MLEIPSIAACGWFLMYNPTDKYPHGERVDYAPSTHLPC
jgi:hypothetical protein